ncbi:MAPEG family protein [Pleionea litopenaei]|uniref:MAPEG family protein n=1 Tax=Pleionea litopenaei TaxID=3070815 RepID=A0AA51X588_9GAMM|nr:MAPEG family protein [Pleionea sp. HL-JVS1]WMS85717.1 MAPEG family protein [Pleionea sp. HL-JVS1]
MFENYTWVYWGLWTIGFTILVQALVASIAHRRQKKYIPGIVDKNLSHESFVFRSHRTFLNSHENVVMFLIPVFVGLFSKMDASTLAAIVWIYAIARLIHMALYYKIATEKNPSPRSYFYIIALFANLVLFILLGMHLIK